MANPYYIEPANPLQALMLGVQGYDAGQKRAQQQAIQEAGQLYASGDVKGAQAAAARGGSLQALMGFAGLQNQDRDFGFRQTESQRAQGNTERGFGLQEKQIGMTAANSAATRDLARQQFEFQKQIANQADVKTVKDAAGNETLVRVDRQGNATPINTGVSQAGGNPFGGGKFNEVQGKAAGFTDRMLQSENVLQDWKGTTTRDATRDQFSDLVGYNVRSPEFQKYDQARRDFINAQLRRESGAVISAQEFDNANKQYFPVPGDTQEVLRQKAMNRRAAIEAMGRDGGPSYAPKSNYNADGRVAPLNAQSAQAQPKRLKFNPATGELE
jgi:hypothetical protein